jgi:prepilin-type N-terminal cleavage/methylation domain-containing protein
MKRSAFTIIELMTVMGVLTVLMSITLIAINPAHQFKQANDGKRRSDVVEILNAVTGYMSNNLGSPPLNITTTATEIGVGSGYIDLCADLVPDYVATFPYDPDLPKTSDPCPAKTGYEIKKIVNPSGSVQITVSSLNEPSISMTK